MLHLALPHLRHRASERLSGLPDPLCALLLSMCYRPLMPLDALLVLSPAPEHVTCRPVPHTGSPEALGQGGGDGQAWGGPEGESGHFQC